jgi:hypothetical protein
MGQKGVAIGHLFTYVCRQCLIMLMVARKRSSQCKAPFHHCLYAQFNLQATMPKHWDIINITHLIGKHGVKKTWDGFGKWACHLLHLGVNTMNDS